MMKKRNEFSRGVLVIFADCAFLATSCAQPAQTGITDGRARALIGVAAGLISLIFGGLSLARSAGLIGSGSGRNGAIAALALGLIGIVLSIIHLGGSTGGFGTGGGRAGAIVAFILSLIGISLGGLVLVRAGNSRRAE